MITMRTAERIWSAYREIETAKKLLSDMKEVRGKEYIRRDEPTLKDAFGRRQHLELGVPSGESGHRIFRVAPELAESVIRAHISKQERALVEAQESARIEIDTPESKEAPNEDG
jgi:hypothetical protein